MLIRPLKASPVWEKSVRPGTIPPELNDPTLFEYYHEKLDGIRLGG